MPTYYEACFRHANLYLTEIEKADKLFAINSSQLSGVKIFDQNREQIEGALDWLTRQNPVEEIDIIFGRFVDSFTAIGLARYNAREKLVPLLEQKIVAVQRLGLKELIADAYDELGILYAFLGYLPQAMKYFQIAHDFASETREKELKQEIQRHIIQAQKQLNKNRLPALVKLFQLVDFVRLQFQLSLAQTKRNPFSEIVILNKLANIYLDWGKLESAARFFRDANSVSKRISYRFGELQAALGLLQVEIEKGQIKNQALLIGSISNLSDGFEWQNSFLVFETLLELAPAIEKADAIAQNLHKKNDPRATEIYEQLDQIMFETDKIFLAVHRGSSQKDDVFLSGLNAIRNNLQNILDFSK